jgi:hypothetical protein
MAGLLSVGSKRLVRRRAGGGNGRRVSGRCMAVRPACLFPRAGFGLVGASKPGEGKEGWNGRIGEIRSDKQGASQLDNNCRMARIFSSLFLSPQPRRPQGYTRAPGPGVGDAKTTPAPHLLRAPWLCRWAGGFDCDWIGSDRTVQVVAPSDVTTLGSRSLALTSTNYTSTVVVLLVLVVLSRSIKKAI